MNRILKEITVMMEDCLRTQLSEVPMSEFEEDKGDKEIWIGKRGQEE